MILGSLEYLIFLAAVALAARLLGRWRAVRLGLLLAASYAFYALDGLAHLPLLAAITLTTYGAGLALTRLQAPAARRLALIAACLVNLGLLFVFKYTAFFAQNVAAVLGPAWAMPTSLTSLTLPLGLSYIAFQCTGYVIDAYRDPQRGTRDLLGLSLYASFFPVITAGPILRGQEFLSQLDQPREPDNALALEGAERILRGLVKKSLLAASLGAYVSAVYSSPQSYGPLNHLLGVYAFAWQIYFDFSGYTDIALGSANLLGWRLRENFNLPYLATNPSDYWRRWHISLSQWLRDYLYISLGGSRKGHWRTYFNATFTMTLCGLWHGASWNYVLWGLHQGLWVSLHRFLEREKGWMKWVPHWLAWVACFHLVCSGYVFFRAENLHHVGIIFSSFWRPETPVFAMPSWEVWLGLVVGLFTHLAAASPSLRQAWADIPLAAKAVAYALALTLVVLYAPPQETFIYAQF